MDDETQPVHEQRLNLNEAAEEMQQHLLAEVANRIMGTVLPDTPVRIEVGDLSERIRQAEAMAEAAHNRVDPLMDYHNRLRQLHYEAGRTFSREHRARCMEEIERIQRAWSAREEEHVSRGRTVTFTDNPWDIEVTTSHPDPIQAVARRIRDLEREQQRLRRRGQSASRHSVERDLHFARQELEQLRRREDEEARRRAAREDRPSVQFRGIRSFIEPGWIRPEPRVDRAPPPLRAEYDADALHYFLGNHGRWSSSEPQAQERPRDFQFQGITVEANAEMPNDRVFLYGTRNEPWVHTFGDEPGNLQDVLEEAIARFTAVQGRRPNRIRLSDTRHRDLGLTPVRTPNPEPLTGHELRRREQMNTEGKRVHLTTRDGYKKTIRIPGEIGAMISIPEQQTRTATVGAETGPVGSTIVRRDFEVVRKALYTELPSGLRTEEYWAVERG